MALQSPELNFFLTLDTTLSDERIACLAAAFLVNHHCGQDRFAGFSNSQEFSGPATEAFTRQSIADQIQMFILDYNDDIFPCYYFRPDPVVSRSNPMWIYKLPGLGRGADGIRRNAIKAQRERGL